MVFYIKKCNNLDLADSPKNLTYQRFFAIMYRLEKGLDYVESMVSLAAIMASHSALCCSLGFCFTR